MPKCFVTVLPMKCITAEVQNLNTISLRTHLRSSDTVSRHQKNGFVETGGVRGVTVKATESDLVPGAVVGLDYLEVSPPKLSYRMRRVCLPCSPGSSRFWEKDCKHLTVEASPLPFPSLSGKALGGILVGGPQGHAAL